MKTKLIACFFTLVMLLAFTTPVMADQIFTGDVIKLADGVGSTGGGIFIVSNTSRVMTPFDTFCVELDEHLAFGPSYTVSVDTAAIEGGVGGPSPDPLDYTTAYLYYAFRTNTLITAFDKNSVNDVNSLQKAIWYFEQEYTLGQLDAKALLFKAEAEAAGWTDIGKVRVLNLTSIPYATQGQVVNNQSVLTLVPEPLTLLLLGFGLLGLGITRRKLTK